MIYTSLNKIYESTEVAEYKNGKTKLVNFGKTYQKLQLEKSRLNRFIRDVHYSGDSDRKKSMNVTKQGARERVGSIQDEIKKLQQDIEKIVSDNRDLRTVWTTIKTGITTDIERIEADALVAKNPDKAKAMKAKNKSDKIRQKTLIADDKSKEEAILSTDAPNPELSDEHKQIIKEKIKKMSTEIKRIKEKKQGTNPQDNTNDALNRRQGRLQREQRKLKSKI